MKKKTLLLSLLFLHLLTYVSAQRQMEWLGRGVHAIAQADGKVFVSWRLFGTDSRDIAFNVYRQQADGKAIKLNKQPVSNSTSFIDTNPDTTNSRSYFVKTLLKGKEGAASAPFLLKPGTQPYVSLPLKTPAGYAPNDASVGDLDGDGEYEIILHQTGKGRDNSQAGITDPPIFQAYKMDGTLLWTINLGRNIREGAHYTQFMVYDLDGDGRAEIAMKTADGSIDAKGKVIGDSSKDYRNDKGYILAGPEYLTVFDGLTGAALFTTDYIPARYPTSLNPSTNDLKSLWGDGYGNRMDRFLACIAYLDGVHPSLVMCRGYYTRTVVAAWDWKNGKLTSRWVFDTQNGYPAYAGQGNHNLTVSDVDGDGKDEIVYGAMTIDDNGKGLYSTGLGHGDALHVTDLDPSRPGLEVFDIQERFDDAGANFRDAKTGEVIWKKASVKAGDDGEGPGRGLALDIDPRYPGYECWVAGAGITGMFDAKGNKIADRTPACNMGIYWDGDVLSEILNGTTIDKWDYLNSKTDRLLQAAQYNCVHNNGTKSNPVLSADIWGDWREEVIYRTADNQELRIFSTTIPTTHRFYTLMHDPQYRLSIAWQNVAYNQPPHTGFHLGEGMQPPPVPKIKLIKQIAPGRDNARK
ncbi:rhamnogalacturonan lyase [Paraflavitalea sp. CAU 1676]|uniref:rhamnogalacturonan lyase n=1 Tax=Paraflavitalea sp. CAU 1676 TaxID=3032598 RepID=UPI0023DCD408|nr:rhamnogalacturonan lyase [Paraflavitalea sp. CAU 1676]MDF2193670.1 rhamnogalacturonan lyase [Paraflavitalea sp. CAU 1676]